MSQSFDTKPHDQPRELVVLVHGISSTRWWMWPLAKRLRSQGFATQLYTYFTLIKSNRHNGRKLADYLHKQAATGNWTKIHLVVHSMGSIVTRCALLEDLPDQLGRVVMIGPPNGGSHMATKLRHIYWFATPLMEMKDQPDSFVNTLPPAPAHVDIGVLAAKHDNVIHVDRTHLPEQRDHRVLDTWHTGALWHPDTAGLAANFLRKGHFGEATERDDQPRAWLAGSHDPCEAAARRLFSKFGKLQERLSKARASK